MGEIKIKLQSISKSYFSETAVTQALQNISLTFAEREFVAITGESGSGKTTLLNIIGGMDTFDDGEMFVDGQPTFQYDDQDWEEYRRNKIGYVFQDYSLVGHYTALYNVMSALMAMGTSREQAEQTAIHYLQQVGLQGFEKRRASRLSSGQKQRLAIARALAKNTGIIVADEPTGNLDSETGEQIVRLLKELSKDRLVVMVTHNYEQVEKYVTRRIRLHDGNVVSDVTVRQNDLGSTAVEKQARQELSGAKTESGKAAKKSAEGAPVQGGAGWWKEFCRQSRFASYFASMNCRTQPGRGVLFTAFIFVVSAMSFLFIGELFMYSDDTLTKLYSTTVFYREDPVRLVVKRADGGDIIEEDLKKLYSVPDVLVADSCDYANDINFYLKENEDYKYLYGTSDNEKGRDFRLLSFLNENHFVMSTDCIADKDIAKGHLPESRNEIVLYSEDENILGSEVMCYFTAKNIWGINQYYGKKLTVVGILRNETEQVYFSKELCQMLSLHMDYGAYRFWYQYDPKIEDYEKKEEFIPMIAEDLEGDTVRKSFLFYNEKTGEETGPKGDTPFTFEVYDKEGKPTGEITKQQVYALRGREGLHEMSLKIMEVSEEFFYRYYPRDKKSRQASIYLTSYARIKPVAKRLKKMGYETQSTYQVGVTDYIDSLVHERLVIIGISAFGLLAGLLAQVLILRSLMRIHIKDFLVLKFIGMRVQILRKISYFELGVYCIAAMFLAVLVMWILRFTGIPAVQEMMWYYNLWAYLAFVAYNLAVSVLTALSFNHMLSKRLRA